MSETKLWQDLKKNIPDAYMTRIDAESVPDVDVIFNDGRAGWIELKYIPAWPVKLNTKVNTGLKPHQAIWMFDYARHGGRGYIFIRCGSDYLFMDGMDSIAISKGLTKAEAIKISKLYCVGKMDWEKLKELF